MKHIPIKDKIVVLETNGGCNLCIFFFGEGGGKRKKRGIETETENLNERVILQSTEKQFLELLNGKCVSIMYPNYDNKTYFSKAMNHPSCKNVIACRPEFLFILRMMKIKV